MLLQHGVVGGGNCDWQPFEPTQWAQVAAMLPYSRVAFRPGSQWTYSNLGCVFLGQIIDRISGDDFEIYLTKNILMPLEMTASCFDRSLYFLESQVSASYLRAGTTLTAGNAGQGNAGRKCTPEK